MFDKNKPPSIFYPGMGSLNIYMENEILMLYREGLKPMEIAKTMRISYMLVHLFLQTGRGLNKVKSQGRGNARPYRVGLKYNKDKK